MGGFQRLAAEQGVTLSAPFLDDRVIEAALSARALDRFDPSRYKPLLVDAMRGVVPAPTLARTTKSETSAGAVMGGRRHRDQLLGLGRDSLLGELGLIDAGAFLFACQGPAEASAQHRRVEPTLSCESWLRTVKEANGVRVGA